MTLPPVMRLQGHSRGNWTSVPSPFDREPGVVELSVLLLPVIPAVPGEIQTNLRETTGSLGKWPDSTQARGNCPCRSGFVWRIL